MTRLAIAMFGTGYTFGVATVALTGQLTCASLGFSAGIVFTLAVLIIAGAAVIYAGYKLGWLKHFTHEHSQHGGD